MLILKSQGWVAKLVVVPGQQDRQCHYQTRPVLYQRQHHKQKSPKTHEVQHQLLRLLLIFEEDQNSWRSCDYEVKVLIQQWSISWNRHPVLSHIQVHVAGIGTAIDSKAQKTPIALQQDHS